jgi:hypothetical protein
MPVTIDEIKQHLDALDVRHLSPKSEERRLRECGARFATESYLNPEGARQVLLVFDLSEDGEYLQICAVDAFDVSKCGYKAALFAAMLHLAYQTKHVQLEYHAERGGVHFTIDFPVCDGTVTRMQLDRMIHVLLGLLEQYYPVLAHAMGTGEIDWSRAWRPHSVGPEESGGPDGDPDGGADQAPSDDKTRALAELVASMGGIEKLEDALRELRAKGGA